jgi:Ring finger domain
MISNERLHQSRGDFDLHGYDSGLDDDDDSAVSLDIFARQYAGRKCSTPVAPTVLQNLPTVRVRSVERYICCLPCTTPSTSAPIDDCTICSTSFVVESTVVRLPCSHMYHPNCIDAWLRMHNTCPVCRSILPTLEHFTTPRWILQQQRHRQREEMDGSIVPGPTLHPIPYTRHELLGMSIVELKQICTQWVICTYHQTFMSLNIPETIDKDDHDSLISYLITCKVVTCLPSHDESTPG